MSEPLNESPPNQAFPAEPLGEHWLETLDDGSHVLIRPLRAEDRERECRFINRLSAETQRLRFLGNMSEASPALLDQLMDLDYRTRMAYVALVHDNGELREVGVSRYCASGDGEQCECAIVVADDWRHRGLSTALMRHLIDMAKKQGFRQMYSLDSASNVHMHDLARQLGFHSQRDPDDATQVIHRLHLQGDCA
jgi:GNAT superfamily N-acetyltransferase